MDGRGEERRMDRGEHRNCCCVLHNFLQLSYENNFVVFACVYLDNIVCHFVLKFRLAGEFVVILWNALRFI